MRTEDALISGYVAIGRIARPAGRHGEVAVDSASEPSRFFGLSRVFLDSGAGDLAPFEIEGVRLHKGRSLLKLSRVSSIDEARELAGRVVLLPASEIDRAPEGVFYQFELVGLEVRDPGRGLGGTVKEVLTTGGTDVVVVADPEGGEVLLPLCAEICRRIDPKAGLIEVETPEGLWELNAN